MAALAGTLTGLGAALTGDSQPVGLGILMAAGVFVGAVLA